MMKKEKSKGKNNSSGYIVYVPYLQRMETYTRISRLSLRCKDECEDKNKKLDVNRCKLDNYIIIEKNSEWKKY